MNIVGIGPGDESHIELAVLDRTGRLQIPAEYLDALGFRGSRAGRRIKVELEEDRIVLLNPEEPEEPEEDQQGDPE